MTQQTISDMRALINFRYGESKRNTPLLELDDVDPVEVDDTLPDLHIEETDDG